MNVDEKIIEFLKSKKGIENATISETNVTTGKNKDGNNLVYVRVSVLEKQLGINYSNEAIYYGFDMEGNYVGCVKVSVLNSIPPTEVEMEYWANGQYRNKGNMTILAQDVIRDIFELKLYDDLKVREGLPTSNIESIMVMINKDNLASIAVARKLGFDEKGYLNIDDYKNKSSISI